MQIALFGRAIPALLVTVSLSMLSLVANAATQGAHNKTAGEAQRTKVAEGEYVIVQQANGGAIGPFGEEIYNFHETWTIWKLANGAYQAEGERRFESPKGSEHADRFAADLSRDLTLTRVTEFARLRWRRDSGPLSCEFGRSLLHCSSNAKKADDSIELKIPMHAPFGFLWPVSAFSFSGLTREAERDPHAATHIQLVTVEQPSAEMPVSPMVLDGDLRYLGEDEIQVAGKIQRAFKFSIKVALSPELLVWTSPKGLLLAISVEHADKRFPEESLKTLHFQEWGFE
jgi:hypothetical protein